MNVFPIATKRILRSLAEHVNLINIRWPAFINDSNDYYAHLRF